MNISIAKDALQIARCFKAMKALRPHLEENTFPEVIAGMMTRGYHLVYIAENGVATAAGGYRFTEHLAWGKVIYIDDLTTLPEARGKGHASALLDYIFAVALSHNCDEVHLDSGCVPARYDAHRLYLKKGFNISSHHFAKKIQVSG